MAQFQFPLAVTHKPVYTVTSIFFISIFSPPCLVFEEPEDPSNRSFFSEIISSISDVKFSHSGRYMMTRDYLSVKVWDLNMENRPVETYQVRRFCYTNIARLWVFYILLGVVVLY